MGRLFRKLLYLQLTTCLFAQRAPSAFTQICNTKSAIYPYWFPNSRPQDIIPPHGNYGSHSRQRIPSNSTKVSGIPCGTDGDGPRLRRLTEFLPYSSSWLMTDGRQLLSRITCIECKLHLAVTQTKLDLFTSSTNISIAHAADEDDDNSRPETNHSCPWTKHTTTQLPALMADLGTVFVLLATPSQGLARTQCTTQASTIGHPSQDFIINHLLQTPISHLSLYSDNGAPPNPQLQSQQAPL